MSQILGNLSALTWQMAAMWAIGGVMIYLAICKEMEPTLLLPMGFGCILCNLPNSGAVEVLETLFQAGVANELFPLLLFIGIGVKIDPDGFHIMKKSEYSGQFGDYSSYSEEYEELADASLETDEEESGDEE